MILIIFNKNIFLFNYNNFYFNNKICYSLNIISLNNNKSIEFRQIKYINKAKLLIICFKIYKSYILLNIFELTYIYKFIS